MKPSQSVLPPRLLALSDSACLLRQYFLLIFFLAIWFEFFFGARGSFPLSSSCLFAFCVCAVAQLKPTLRPVATASLVHQNYDLVEMSCRRPLPAPPSLSRSNGQLAIRGDKIRGRESPTRKARKQSRTKKKHPRASRELDRRREKR